MVIFCKTSLLAVCQDECLLRKLLPSPSPTAEHSQQSHHTHNDEQWLVSSGTQEPQTRDPDEVSKLQKHAKLREVLQDQLSQQLQQERTTAEMLQQRFEQQQQMNTDLQHQLEQSRLDAQSQKRQLKMLQLEVDEAHQRAQLQDLLTEQLHSQLQETTEQRDWYRQQNQQLDVKLAPAAVRECKGLEVRDATPTRPCLKPSLPCCLRRRAGLWSG